MCFSQCIDGIFGTAIFFESGMRNPGGQVQVLEASGPVPQGRFAWCVFLRAMTEFLGWLVFFESGMRNPGGQGQGLEASGTALPADHRLTNWHHHHHHRRYKLEHQYYQQQ